MIPRKIALTFYSYLTISWEDIVRSILTAEKAGFNCALLSESAYRDATILLGKILSKTKRIRVGTNIVNVYSRTPTQIAMALATLNEVYNQRIELLALGASNPHWIEKFHGVKFEKALSKMKEYVTVIRALFSGENVNCAGQHFTVHDVQFRDKPVKIPIYLGVTGPKMLRLAGEVADGVILNSLSTPQYIRYAIDQIKAGAADGSRDWKKIDIGCSIVVAASKDEKAARRAAARAFLYYMRIPNDFDPLIRESGFDPKEFEPIREAYWGGDMLKTLTSPTGTGNMSRAESMVTDKMLDAFTVYGNPRRCRERLAEYEKAGVTFPVIRSAVDEETGIEAVLANIKTVSQLLKH